MSRYLPVIALAVTLSSLFAARSHAGGTGFPTAFGGHCADSKFQTPRYNQLLPYRHYEDRRRYNAAPCCGEIVQAEPYLLKTVVVSRKQVPYYHYDQNGNRRCHKVMTVTYKELFSDGSCRVWSEQV